MKITNNCSFDVIAFGWDTGFGYGDEVRIHTGQSAQVSGQYIGEMGEESCRLALEGEIVCHEGADDEKGMHVSEGNQLAIQSETRGITVRHCCDERDV